MRLCLLGASTLPPGPRPLCGHCPGLILRLAATRPPGALRLCSMPGRAYGATVTSAASHAFIFHRKMGALRPFRFFISSVSSYFVIMDVRVCRCRRESRRYAALPLGGFNPPPPRAATALRPLPGANIETCRYAAARRSAPLLHARPCIWGNRHQRGVTCIYIP